MDIWVVTEDGPWLDLSPEAGQAAAEHGLGAHLETFAVRGSNPRRIHSVHRFEDGMVRQDHGKRPAVLRWDAITTLRTSAPFRPSSTSTWGFSFTFKAATGPSFEVGGCYAQPGDRGHDYYVFGQETHDRAYGRVFAELRARLDRGEAIRFGRAEIKAAGLAVGRRPVPWSEVSRVAVDEGCVRMWQSGGTDPVLKVRTNGVDNVEPLLQLVGELRGV